MNTLENARGKWHGILSYIGVPSHALNGKHQPCPVCGNGKDTFRFADKEVGQWFCNYCDISNNNKTGFDFVKLFLNLNNKQALDKIDEALGTDIKKVIQPKRDPRIALNAVRSRVGQANDGVINYLKGRCLNATNAIGSAFLDYWENGKKSGSYNAMVCRIVDHMGKPQSYHITYLEGAKKADLNVNKKVMTPVDTITGCAIRLFPVAEKIGIAEGIETALACHKIYGVPTWATITAHGMESFIVPKGVKQVVIFSDNDSNFVGQSSAYNCARRLAKEGIEVKVIISEKEDFNDDLMEYEL